MKKIAFLLALFFTSYVGAQNWQKTYDDALALSKKESKPLLLVFSGSDWCGPCIKLDKEIWQSNEFSKYAETVVLYKADFPKRKGNKLPEDLAKSNALLAEKYNPNGYFPLVVLLDANQKVLGKTGYKKATPSEYIDHLTTFVK